MSKPEGSNINWSGRYDSHKWDPISVAARPADPSIVRTSFDYHTKRAGFPFPVSARDSLMPNPYGLAFEERECAVTPK